MFNMFPFYLIISATWYAIAQWSSNHLIYVINLYKRCFCLEIGFAWSGVLLPWIWRKHNSCKFSTTRRYINFNYCISLNLFTVCYIFSKWRFYVCYFIRGADNWFHINNTGLGSSSTLPYGPWLHRTSSFCPTPFVVIKPINGTECEGRKKWVHFQHV